MTVASNNLIALLVIIPMAAAIVSIPLRGRTFAQRAVGLLSLVAVTGLATWFTATLPADTNLMLSRMGAWELPFGIATAVDGVSGPLLIVTGIVSLACFIAS